jgi:hypothetical protein
MMSVVLSGADQGTHNLLLLVPSQGHELQAAYSGINLDVVVCTGIHSGPAELRITRGEETRAVSFDIYSGDAAKSEVLLTDLGLEVGDSLRLFVFERGGMSHMVGEGPSDERDLLLSPEQIAHETRQEWVECGLPIVVMDASEVCPTLTNCGGPSDLVVSLPTGMVWRYWIENAEGVDFS